jgi:hypothetical protein
MGLFARKSTVVADEWDAGRRSQQEALEQEAIWAAAGYDLHEMCEWQLSEVLSPQDAARWEAAGLTARSAGTAVEGGATIALAEEWASQPPLPDPFGTTAAGVGFMLRRCAQLGVSPGQVREALPLCQERGWQGQSDPVLLAAAVAAAPDASPAELTALAWSLAGVTDAGHVERLEASGLSPFYPDTHDMPAAEYVPWAEVGVVSVGGISHWVSCGFTPEMSVRYRERHGEYAIPAQRHEKLDQSYAP